jgi:hypothetical protein
MTQKDADASSARAARRAARAAAGAAGLGHRLEDALRAGLAAPPAPQSGWAEVAARMVDAQAPGLAARVRELDSLTPTGPEGPGRLLEELALLHLLATGYGRVEQLPESLAATVRARIGFTLEAAEVRDGGPRLHDRWLVLGTRDTADGQLTARRVWLHGTRTQRLALLLTYSRPGRSPEPALRTGHTVEAEVAYYPGNPQLRATLAGMLPEPKAEQGADAIGSGTPAEHGQAAARGGPLAKAGQEIGREPSAAPGSTTAGGVGGTVAWPFGLDALPTAAATPPPPPGVRVAAALDAYAAALVGDPWLEAWPVALRDVVPVFEGCWQLADAAGPERAAIAVDRRATAESGFWRLAALSGGHPLTVFGTCGHRGFAPVTAWVPASDGTLIPMDVTR